MAFTGAHDSTRINWDALKDFEILHPEHRAELISLYRDAPKEGRSPLELAKVFYLCFCAVKSDDLREDNRQDVASKLFEPWADVNSRELFEQEYVIDNVKGIRANLYTIITTAAAGHHAPGNVAVKYADFLREVNDIIGQAEKRQNTSLDAALREKFPEIANRVYINAQKWDCNDGIKRVNAKGECVGIASPKPIFPVTRYKDVHTGKESVKIAWGPKLTECATASRGVLASSNKVVALADNGAPVTSNTARYLVDFVSDVIEENDCAIPEIISTSTFGWNEYDGKCEFVPYSDKLQFMSGSGIEDDTLLKALTPKGSLDEWMDAVTKHRNSNPLVRIFLAASLASCLVGRLHLSPFFVYIWGQSGAGKSVLLSLAASVWGSPNTEDGYIKTANSTLNALAEHLSTLNHFPGCIDECQTRKDTRIGDGADDFIMQLAQGIGRSRLNSDGSQRKTGVWRSVSFLNGENSIISNETGEGTRNRVIDIHCPNVILDSSDCASIMRCISNNYGVVGQAFVSTIASQDMQQLAEVIDVYAEQLQSEYGVTGKHATIAASLLCADDLACATFPMWDKCRLTINDLLPYLITTGDLNKAKEAYEQARAIIAENINNFVDVYGTLPTGRVWGAFNRCECNEPEIVTDVYILTAILRDELKKRGYVLKTFLDTWMDRGYIEAFTENGKRTHQKVKHLAHNQKARCMHFRNYDTEH